MSNAEPTHSAPSKVRATLRVLGRGISVFITLILTALLGFVIYVGIGRPVSVPDWLRTEVEVRAAEALGAATVQFDKLDVVMAEGQTPSVRMTDVRLYADTGAEIAAFGMLRAGVSLPQLLKGEVRVSQINLDGIFAKLLRDQDGSFSLSGGVDFSAPSQRADSFAQLIERIDAVFERPALASLQDVDIQSLNLRVEDRRSDRVWTIDGGRVHLTRVDDALGITADVALLSGGQGVATLQASYDSNIGSPAATFGVIVDDVAAGDIATLAPPFAWLEVLRAPISGALRGGVHEDGSVAPLNATLSIGQGVIQPNDATRPVPFNSASSYFTYDPKQRVLTFDELSVDSAWVKGRLEGQTVIGVGADGRLEDIVGQFSLNGLSANPDGFYPEPVSLDAAEMDFRMALNPFRLDVGQALLRDQGQLFQVRGMLEAAPEGWTYSVDGRLDGMSPERLMELWPVRLVSKTRKWISENVVAGRLHDVDLVLRGQPNARPTVYVGFGFEDAEVRYVKTLPNITGASGTASLLDNRFVAFINDGIVTAAEGGQVTVAGSSFAIPDVTIKGGVPAVVRLETQSSITAGLSILNQPPLTVMDKANLAPNLADGRLSVSGTLSLPLRRGLKLTDLVFDATGTARDVVSTTLLTGRRLTASALNVTATNEQVRVGGPGTLDGVPFDATWTQVIGQGPQPSRVAGKIELSERTIDAFRIGLPAGMVRGQGSGEFVVGLPLGGAAPTFTLDTNLRGLRLSSPPLGWNKGANQTGTLSIAGRLGARPSVERLNIDAAGLRATGSVTLTPGGGLERARFDRVRVGQWLDAPVDLIGRGANRAPRVDVRGGSLDLRRADFGGSSSGNGGAQGGGPLSLALDRLQVTDAIALTGMRGQFNLARGLEGDFTAKINDGADIKGQMLPQDGRSAIRVTAQDAGRVAASAGILKQARGGTLSLTLRPVGSASFDGTLTIDDTRIQDAPAIAALLNALSIVGLLEQLDGAGIHFQQVEAAFRLTPSTMTLTQASAVGPSMGLSMFGTYDVTRSILDMKGVISPLFLVNGIGSIFTRKGEGLIGFNYSLSGAASNPRVQVNPLSALTPGLFRELFRRPPPKAPKVEGVLPSAPNSVSKSFAATEPQETNSERRRREQQEAVDRR
ncbi:MAG: DUF3971 domain-containing protein [Tateyamaria sp.]|uniref:YhdP family protein n=1 Tax=Tateyamaria sp. TaxID=1929288 RepID=UPI0032A024DC